VATRVVVGRSLSIGRVFNRAFATIGANPVLAFGLALLFYAVPVALSDYAMQNVQRTLIGGTSDMYGYMAVSLAAFVAGLAISFMFQAVAQAAIVSSFIVDRDGDRPAFGGAIGPFMRRFLPLVVVSLICSIGFTIGFALLFVPYILLWVRWIVAPAVVVAEGKGLVDAFRRSALLTRGARWAILGLNLIVMIISTMFIVVAGIAIYAVAGRPPPNLAAMRPAELAMSMIAYTLVGAFMAAIQAALYAELRDWKTGPSTGNLAEIFR